MRPVLQGLLDAVVGSAYALARGETVFLQGDATRGLHLVERGRVRLVRHTRTGERVSVHVARSGETFAEASLFSPRHHCDAIADVASRVVVVPRAAALEAMRERPELALQLAARLAAQVQELRARLELRSVRGATEQVRLYLALIADGAGEVPRDRPLVDLATDIGLTPEAFYRALAELKRAGIVDGSRRELRLRRR